MVSSHQARVSVDDATCVHRFVRRLLVYSANDEAPVVLVTPPEDGAIAPRAAGLPRVEDDVYIVDGAVLDAVLEWLGGGSRLDGRTISDLARLAPVATTQLAVLIGERAGRLAHEAVSPFGGPMRGGSIGDDVRRRLRPLERAAQLSERAEEAWVAALAAAAPRSR